MIECGIFGVSFNLFLFFVWSKNKTQLKKKLAQLSSKTSSYIGGGDGGDLLPFLKHSQRKNDQVFDEKKKKNSENLRWRAIFHNFGVAD